MIHVLGDMKANETYHMISVQAKLITITTYYWVGKDKEYGMGPVSVSYIAKSQYRQISQVKTFIKDGK